MKRKGMILAFITFIILICISLLSYNEDDYYMVITRQVSPGGSITLKDRKDISRVKMVLTENRPTTSVDNSKSIYSSYFTITETIGDTKYVCSVTAKLIKYIKYNIPPSDKKLEWIEVDEEIWFQSDEQTINKLNEIFDSLLKEN